MTIIYQYLTDKLGAAPAADTLRQLPINSNTSGHRSGSADVRIWRILLQKSFCIDQHKFSVPYARRSNKHLRDYIICDELTGDFGNGLEATSAGDCGSFCQFAGNDRKAFWGFCNKIGTFETCRQIPKMSVHRGRSEVTVRRSK